MKGGETVAQEPDSETPERMNGQAKIPDADNETVKKAPDNNQQKKRRQRSA